MIDFKNVSKVYDNGTKALSNVNIHIDKGEFVFVVGASGAGKSTFLKLIMREEVASSGSIVIKGYNLNEMKKKKIPYFRRNMGIVFQDFRLIPTMTVYDNVAFAMRVVGAREKDIRKRVPYVINIVDLSAKARNYPNELSGGEQQRVAIARALVKKPKLLLCDEPTGALDYETGIQVLKLIKKVSEIMKMTVLIITHNSAIAPIADRVLTMKSGKISKIEINETPMPIERIEW